MIKSQKEDITKEVIMENEVIKIAVHNGNFHADDVTAFAILNKIFPNNELVRTRDPDELKSCTFRVDVGLYYNGETDFDHHQRDFKEVRSNNDHIKYASAGLVWKKFGDAYIKLEAPNATAEQIQRIKEYIDYNFIRYVDANDNGINLFNEEIPTISKIAYLYNLKYGYINNNGFKQCAHIISDVIDGFVISCINYLESEQYVLEAIKGKEDQPIMFLDKKVGFQEVVKNNWDIFSKIMIAVYPDANGKTWRIQSLAGDPNDRFKNRCRAPKSWRGLQDKDLNKVAELENLDFVHVSGFTGGAKDKESVLKMAEKWWKESPGND